MKNLALRCAPFLFVLLLSSAASGQQRWFETGTTAGSSYKRVEREKVAAIVFYDPAGPNPAGAHIYTFSDGSYGDWGAVPKGSSSLTKLRDLIRAKPERWVKAQPHEQGSYLRPNEAVGYFDLNRVVSSIKVTPIEFGQEVYALGFEYSQGRAAVIEAGEKARIDTMIADSQVPE